MEESLENFPWIPEEHDICFSLRLLFISIRFPVLCCLSPFLSSPSRGTSPSFLLSLSFYVILSPFRRGGDCDADPVAPPGSADINWATSLTPRSSSLKRRMAPFSPFPTPPSSLPSFCSSLLLLLLPPPPPQSSPHPGPRRRVAVPQGAEHCTCPEEMTARRTLI